MATKLLCIVTVLFLYCVQDLNGADEACETESDCTMKNSRCFEKKCTCDSMSYPNSNNTACYSYATAYKDVCYEPEQCTQFHKSLICSTKNKCECEEKFRWFLGECIERKNYNETCNEAKDCFNGYDLLAMTCGPEKRCICNSDYYFRNPDCRQLGTDSSCALNLDCITGKAGDTCESNAKCTTSAFSTFLSNLETEKKTIINDISNPIPDTECTIDDDCPILNSKCEDSTCVCNSGSIYNNGACIPGLALCTDDCANYNNTICLNDVTCVCKPGYFYNEGTCAPEFGLGGCENCPSKPSQCIDGACYCPAWYFSDQSNRNCYKTIRQSNLHCVTDEWCRALGPYAYCNTEQQCQCTSNSELNQDTMYCQPKGGSDVECITTDDCALYQECENEKCKCTAEYELVGNDCVPVFGGNCVYKDCSEKFVCSKGTCTCRAETVPSADQTMCLSAAKNVGDPCEEDLQCTYNLKNTECSDSNCTCYKNYVLVNNSCYEPKSYNSLCTSSFECSIVMGNEFQCRNSLCQCHLGKKYVDGTCISSAGSLVASILLLSVTLMLSVVYK